MEEKIKEGIQTKKYKRKMKEGIKTEKCKRNNEREDKRRNESQEIA